MKSYIPLRVLASLVLLVVLLAGRVMAVDVDALAGSPQSDTSRVNLNDTIGYFVSSASEASLNSYLVTAPENATLNVLANGDYNDPSLAQSGSALLTTPEPRTYLQIVLAGVALLIFIQRRKSKVA